LRALGREQAASELFHAIDVYASKLESETPKIDYFATSLPAMLLFEEDLQERQNITARFLHAQAQLGLGNKEQAKHLLKAVLTKDRSHAGAIDLLATLSAEEG